jgi:transcriptional regulator GlxA family with amidase domain
MVHRVAILALDDVIALDVAIPAQVFGERPQTAYRVTTCGLQSEVRTANGFSLVVPGGLDDVRRADTVVVPGYANPRRELPPRVLETLAEAHARGRRLVSICTGAFALAAAGVLDGLEAATHWLEADDLAARYPLTRVNRDALYVDTGQVLTSAGVLSGMDLCLHIVRKDFGAAVANAIARGLVTAPHRDGGQTQYIDAPVAVDAGLSLASTREWALGNLEEPLTVRQLATQAGMSDRTLARRFVAETGVTPLQWLLVARVGRARVLLETTAYGIDRVARESGLGTAANLRARFRHIVGTTPAAYRRTFGS